MTVNFSAFKLIPIFVLAFTTVACAQQKSDQKLQIMDEPINEKTEGFQALEVATFGSGCFWCTEAFFERLEGVKSVVSGYSGGHVKNPAYREVCNGTTGHAEVTQITYDPSVITYTQLLEVFWATHDPTTLNRQGNDKGPQYRSAIFYHDDMQKTFAETSKAAADLSGAWDSPIVTEVSPLKNFYAAGEDHQNYYNLNPEQGYCRAIINPKVEKFKKQFQSMLKEGVK